MDYNAPPSAPYNNYQANYEVPNYQPPNSQQFVQQPYIQQEQQPYVQQYYVQQQPYVQQAPGYHGGYQSQSQVVVQPTYTSKTTNDDQFVIALTL